MQPLMETDSEQLLHAGVGVGTRTFASLLEAGYEAGDFDRTVCHQVGIAHRKLMLESLGLPFESDFATFNWLGNTGAVALPTALALGLRTGTIPAASQVALLGIGSGINSVMMATEWQSPLVGGDLDENACNNLNIAPECSENASAI